MGEPGRAAALRAWVPRWWRGEGGVAGAVLDPLLWPAERLFALGAAARGRAYDAGWLRVEEPPIPVVSVGNVAVGGAGKTPVAAWVAGRLVEWGHRPAVVLRGYGEDEILVHRELNPGVPVLAAPRRVGAVVEAAARGCDVAVLDDGFQHRALARRLDLVLVAAEGWGSRGRLLPRGPWREPPSALVRADLVIVTRKTASREEAEGVAAELRAGVGVERTALCRLAPTGLRPLAGGEAVGSAWLRGREVLAVASLADPTPFVEQLRRDGARPEAAVFPDHHPFSAADAAGLLARAAGRPLVMTRKEAVKLRALLPPEAPAWMVEQRVELESGGETLERALRTAMHQ